MQEKSDLDTWRSEIRAIDAEMIRMTAKRMALALKIGQYKVDHQLPVKDFRVEKEIIERTRAMAEELGLAPDFAEDFMTLVMGHSVNEQNKLHQSQRTSSLKPNREALVIGGLGRMGRWFSQYFQSIGFQIAVHDIDPSELPDSYRRVANLTDDLDRYEVIFLATPFTATRDILRSFRTSLPRGLVIESSSLKSPVLEDLEALGRTGVRVASIHPMFGPDTNLLWDKNILICTGQGLASEEAAKLYFHSTSADLVEVPLSRHDQDMLSTLGLVHFLNLLFGLAFKSQHLSVAEAERRGGSSFLEQLRTSQALYSENHGLSFDIQAANPHTPELFKSLESNYARLKGFIAQGDREGFLNELAVVQACLGTP